jgi:hypothetical protein
MNSEHDFRDTQKQFFQDYYCSMNIRTEEKLLL